MLRKIACSAMLAALAVVPAGAATQTNANYVVRIAILTSCQVTASTVDFGAVGVITGTEHATGTVQVICSQGTPYSISFSPTSSVTALNGQMTNGPNQIGYSMSLSAAGGTGPANHTINAMLFNQATPPGGIYTDSRTVYLNY